MMKRITVKILSVLLMVSAAVSLGGCSFGRSGQMEAYLTHKYGEKFTFEYDGAGGEGYDFRWSRYDADFSCQSFPGKWIDCTFRYEFPCIRTWESDNYMFYYYQKELKQYYESLAGKVFEQYRVYIEYGQPVSGMKKKSGFQQLLTSEGFYASIAVVTSDPAAGAEQQMTDFYDVLKNEGVRTSTDFYYVKDADAQCRNFDGIDDSLIEGDYATVLVNMNEDLNMDPCEAENFQAVYGVQLSEKWNDRPMPKSGQE